jgi:hypothetical protein
VSGRFGLRALEEGGAGVVFAAFRGYLKEFAVKKEGPVERLQTGPSFIGCNIT